MLQPIDKIETNSREMSCPPEAPCFCSKGTRLQGLCVKTKADCDRSDADPRVVPLPPTEDRSGARYGYVEQFLGRSCYLDAAAVRANTDYDASFDDGEPVPESFSFMTYNIWGLAKSAEHQHLFGLRKDLLVRTILEANADLCFMQEMSVFAYEQLAEPLIHRVEPATGQPVYAFASEAPYPAPGSRPVEERKRAVEVYCISKYRPSRIRVIGIEGVLGYKNSFMIVEYPNLVVFNLYSQAGSRSSPGQTHKWLHYSRCRSDILETIHDIMVTEYRDKNMILCGDFNFHIDGGRSDWPELAMMRRILRLGFVDTFRHRNPYDPGFTEDTDLNYMRWNQKLIEKKFRFDAVFAKGPWFIRDSRMIGTESQLLDETESAWFLKHISEFVPGGPKKLAGIRGGLVPINPSDHFGVLTKFGPASPSASPSSLDSPLASNRFSHIESPRLRKKRTTRKISTRYRRRRTRISSR